MHRKRAEDLGDFEKSQFSWELDTEREGSTFGVRRGQTNLRATGTARDVGRWKSQNRKNVYLSPYVEEPLNSKVIKSFVPELRSRKCFSCFEIPLFYVYMLWTFYVRFTHPCIVMLHIQQKQYWYEDQQNDNNQKTKMGWKQLYGHFKRLISNILHEKT